MTVTFTPATNRYAAIVEAVRTPPPAPTRLQQAVAAYRKLLDNRLRDHDAEYRARCEIADAALAEAQEHGE